MMWYSLALLAPTICLIDLVAATPPPKVLGFNFEKSAIKNTAEANRLRKRQSKTLGINIDNADIAYIINMTLGTPPQDFTVQLDTGSADIWVPAIECDICQEGPDVCLGGALDGESSTSFQDNVIDTAFSISYQDGSGVEGDYINETLKLGQVTIKDMTLGLALQASRPIGIMGIGYSADESLASDDSSNMYPNLINQLKDQGHISTLAYSLWLNDFDSLTGSILFGGLDTAKYHGPLTVLPVQKNDNGSYTDFTVVFSSLTLLDSAGKTQFNQDNLALPVILDSGTTATYFPDSIASEILQGVGAVESRQLGTIVPCNLASSPDVFQFGFGGPGGPIINVSLSEFVTPIYNELGDTYTFPDSNEEVCAWGLLSSGPQDPDNPILMGDSFLRSAYVVYNLANNEIGIAQTDFNATDSHVVEISGSSIPGASSTATGAAATQIYTGHPLEQGKTRTAGAQFTGGPLTPTFDLFTSTTATPTSGKKNAGAIVSPPGGGIGVFGLVTGTMVILSTILGGSFIACL